MDSSHSQLYDSELTVRG